MDSRNSCSSSYCILRFMINLISVSMLGYETWSKNALFSAWLKPLTYKHCIWMSNPVRGWYITTSYKDGYIDNTIEFLQTKKHSKSYAYLDIDVYLLSEGIYHFFWIFLLREYFNCHIRAKPLTMIHCSARTCKTMKIAGVKYIY